MRSLIADRDVGVAWQIETAEALLAAGILGEGDWTGEMASTFNQGLLRWASDQGFDPYDEVLGELEIRLIDDLDYHFDVASIVSGLRQAGANAAHSRVSGIGFGSLAYAQIRPRPGVLRLNRLRRNLGLQVMRLLQSAFNCIGAGTFGHLYDFAFRWDEGADEDEERDADQNEISDREQLDLFEAMVPKALWMALDSARWRPRSCREAIRSLGDCQAAGLGLRMTLEAALRLDRDLTDYRTLGETLDMSHHCEEEQVLPVTFTWDPEDRTQQIADEWHDLLSQSGYNTCIALFPWCPGLEGEGIGTARYAARAFKALGRMLVSAAHLAELLQLEDSGQAPASSALIYQPRVPVRIPR